MMLRNIRFVIALGIVAVLAGTASHPAWADSHVKVPASKQEMQLSFAPLVKAAAPAVVNIFTKKQVRQSREPSLFNDPFFEQFFGRNFGRPQRQTKIQNSLGSGVIIDPAGIMITNFHVIAGADEITVALNDKREFRAKVLLGDKATDLAVLKIDKKDMAFPFLKFADSDNLEVGDLVLAIGNPFGVGQSVTSGIISALGRSTGGRNGIESFIQTDAAINPGNSGGALLTMQGTIAGINSAIFSKGGGSLGIGFAIPANMVQSFMKNGLAAGRVRRPWLGVDGQGITPEIAANLGLEKPQGVLVKSVFKDSAADVGGLRPNDIIVAVDGYRVADKQALLFRISSALIGTKAKIDVIRDGAEYQLEVPMAVAPEIPKKDLLLLGGAQPMAGVTVGNLSPAYAIELGLPPFLKGVVVASVKPGSLGARYQLKQKDVIIGVNGHEVGSNKQLQKLLVKANTEWDITLVRNGRRASLRVKR